MTRRNEFMLLTTLVVATRIGDGVTTYLSTPDLGHELNPLAAGGWTLLIAAAAVVIGISTLLNYRQVFHPLDNFPPESGADLRRFKNYYFNPRTNPLAGSRPGKIFGYLFGYCLPRTMIVWSFLLILNNALTFGPYVEFKRQYKLWIAFYLALPMIGMYFAERLQRLDFRRYQNASPLG